MRRNEIEANWLVGFDLDESSYSLTEPEPFLDREDVNVYWPTDTAAGYRADIEFVSARGGERPAIRRAAVICESGPGLSNRQMVAEHCNISDPTELVAWGDESASLWSDGPIEYYVWTCTACGARQVDSPDDEWDDAQLSCIECDCHHPFPWEQEPFA